MTAAQDTLSRVVFVTLIAAVIGVLHLPHSIAGNVEVLSGLLVSAVSILFYIEFLTIATIGNILGGSVFVALLKYGNLRQY